MKIHPHDLLLRRAASTLLRDRGALVAHLKVCPRCRERAAILRERQPGAAPEELARVVPWPETSGMGYGRAFEAAERRFQVHARALIAERAEAPARLAELMKQSPPRREMLVRNHPRFQTWGLLERMIEWSRELCFSDPVSAEALARQAVCLSGSLDQDFYGPGRLEDLRARAWGYVGNARRIQFQLNRAEEAFAKAFNHLEDGTGDVFERTQLLELHASLRRAQQRFADAEALLLRALRIHRKVGEAHRLGRTLVGFGPLYEFMGMTERSIPLLREAVELIDAEREPRLLWSAQHNLISSMIETGRLMEAQRLLAQAGPLYDRFSDGYVQNRRRWTTGRLACALGQPQEAEVHLREACSGFSREGAVYDAVLVSLELATILAQRGKTAELRRVSDEMSAIFASGGIPRESLTPLVLRRASILEQQTR